MNWIRPAFHTGCRSEHVRQLLQVRGKPELAEGRGTGLPHPTVTAFLHYTSIGPVA